MNLKTVWLIISGLAMAGAAVFLWLGRFDIAFVIATIGVVAWFLNYRAQLAALEVKSEPSEDNDSEDS
jgi:hypothetical protein